MANRLQIAIRAKKGCSQNMQVIMFATHYLERDEALTQDYFLPALFSLKGEMLGGKVLKHRLRQTEAMDLLRMLM